MKKFTRFFALALVAMMMFSTVPANASVGAISGNTGNKAGSATNTTAASSGFTIQPIDWDTAVLGQYALPAGYTANRMIYSCDDNTTLGYPIRVSVVVNSKEEDARMQYYCGEDYLQRVRTIKEMPYIEGALDGETMTIMRTYVTADEYCDALALQWAPDAVFYKSGDASSFTGRLNWAYNKMETEIAAGLRSYGMNTDWIETTAAERVYTYTVGSKKYCICVMAEVYGLQYSSSAFGFSITNILWEVPNYYILWCPYESYERIHDGDFAVFVENTSKNDELTKLNDQLNAQISDQVRREMNMRCAASSAYMAAMTALTFSMVESYMSTSHVYTGTYSSDRFSDYLFDQNDYTLSDGSSVKVSTGYNYVWEGSNGTVYYGNSLSDAPGGATQLYPNR